MKTSDFILQGRKSKLTVKYDWIHILPINFIQLLGKFALLFSHVFLLNLILFHFIIFVPNKLRTKNYPKNYHKIVVQILLFRVKKNLYHYFLILYYFIIATAFFFLIIIILFFDFISFIWTTKLDNFLYNLLSNTRIIFLLFLIMWVWEIGLSKKLSNLVVQIIFLFFFNIFFFC
jgi:hypothetical protein